MAETQTQTYIVNGVDWNLPAETVSTTQLTGDTVTSGTRSTTNITNITTTTKTSTSESQIGTTNDYKVTGKSYSTSYDTVTTGTTKYVSQPYMRAGEITKVTGENFAPNTEIRLYLDEIILSPVYVDFSLEKYKSYTFTKEYDRLWMWSWCYDSDTELWKLYSPFSDDAYYYDATNDVWKESNSTTAAVIEDDLDWVKRITRSPWIVKQIESLSSSGTEIVRWKEANDIDPATGEEYEDAYSSSKSTIVTDEDGYFEAHIAIPENTLTGKHTITAETILPAEDDIYLYPSAITTLTGENAYEIVAAEATIDETIDRDVTVTDLYQKYATVDQTITTTTTQVVTIDNDDPIAQTFKVDKDQFLVGLEVYFSQIPEDYLTSSKQPWIALREVNNGVPAEQMLHKQFIDRTKIKKAEIVENDSGENELTSTFIAFDYPIYVSPEKTYAITIGCNEDGYKIYYAKMGNKNIVTGKPVEYQPATGVMMVSSNNSVWSAEQESDLTFCLYKALFNTSNKRTIYVKDINTNMDFFSSLNVSVKHTTFENTGINVYYAITTGTSSTSETLEELANYEWSPMYLDTLITFNSNADYYNDGMKLHLRFDLWTSDTDVSPVINFDTLNILVGKFKDTGAYIQNIITL